MEESHTKCSVYEKKDRGTVWAQCDRLCVAVGHPPTEKETQKSMDELASHFARATQEREYYHPSVESAPTSLDSEDGFTHATFDFTQQLERPCHTRQVGPLYF